LPEKENLIDEEEEIAGELEAEIIVFLDKIRSSGS